MELQELQTSLINDELESVYYFTGEEYAIMDIYIDMIKSKSGLELININSLIDVYADFQTSTIFNTKKIYRIRDDKEFLKNEKIWKEVNANGNIIIFVFTKLDKRSKFYKQHSKQIVEFKKLHENILAKYILKELELNEWNAIELANKCNLDYSRILLECNKIKQYANAENISHTTAYTEIDDEKLIYTAAEDVVFELVDSVCRRQVEKSFKLYNEYKEYNQNPLGVISLLYINMKNALLVQAAGNTNNITNRTGLNSWQIKLVKDKGIVYNIKELVYNIKIISSVEKGIKTGSIDQSISIPYILAKVF